MARWRFGRAAKRRGALGENQQEGVKAVGELEGDAWRLGEVGGPRAAWHGGQRRRGCAAEGEQRKKTKRGGQGLRCKLQKLQGPHCNIKFPTILKLK
jgi:hypothetical protein